MTPFAPDELVEPYYIYHQVAKPFAHLNYEPFEESMRPFLSSEGSFDWEEFVIDYQAPAIIEPLSGWAFTEDFKLIMQSHPHGRFVLQELRPGLTAETYRVSTKVVLHEAVSMCANGSNYFHFLNDFVGRLTLLDREGISRDVPILVPAAFETNHLFREFSALCPLFFKRNWIFRQADTYYEITDRTYFTQVIKCERKNFNGILQEVPAEASYSSERLFITRDQAVGRTATNLSEVEKIVEEFGFTIVDAQNMSVFEQSQRFFRATAIAGFHGAGLTNLIYSTADTPVIEIFPGNFYKGVYYWLSSNFGKPYYAVRGDKTGDNNFKVMAGATKFDSNFYLSPEKLKRTLQQVFET